MSSFNSFFRVRVIEVVNTYQFLAFGVLHVGRGMEVDWNVLNVSGIVMEVVVCDGRRGDEAKACNRKAFPAERGRLLQLRCMTWHMGWL